MARLDKLREKNEKTKLMIKKRDEQAKQKLDEKMK